MGRRQVLPEHDGRGAPEDGHLDPRSRPAGRHALGRRAGGGGASPRPAGRGAAGAGGDRQAAADGWMSTVAQTEGAPARTGRARRRIGVGVIGFGWLGQAHSRSMLRIPTLFPERDFDPELVICGDTSPERVDDAMRSFGFARGTRDWRAVVDDPAVDVVVVAAPNMLHVDLVEAAA